MRLLRRERSGWWTNSYTFSLVDYNPRNGSLPYAILSHRWSTNDKDEVTFQDIKQGKANRKVSGYKKLEFCAEQAAHDGLVHFWVDTCCIDKSNTIEVSTAINSMFRWYQNATKCYVYLPDVSSKQKQEHEWMAAFRHSDWFTRGWTLQELIAPRVVEFFSVEGTKLGSKQSLEQSLCEITGISVRALRGQPLSQIKEQERFDWTVRRETKVEEDMVYCLLGIFDIHMPLIYGEGQQKARARLHRKIQKAAQPNAFVTTDVPWIVPFERNSRFTGYEAQLAQLEEQLFGKYHTSKIAVTGLGGVDKTQLVLELLYRAREMHPEYSVMWIAATTRESLEQGYFKIAQELDIPGRNNENVNAMQLVQDHLSKDSTGPWLLVFDKADGISMWLTVRPVPKDDSVNSASQRPSTTSSPPIDYLSRSRQGRIIFTTRDGKAAARFAPQKIVTITEMSEEIAKELLTKSLSRQDLAGNPQDVSALLAALTYLPLAITQATAYINSRGITLANYLWLLEKKDKVDIDVLSEDFEDYGLYRNVKNPIATTWWVSFEYIRHSDPLAAEYLSFMACMHHRDIPQSLLPRGRSRRQEMDAIGTLSAYSFVSRRPGGTVLDLHRLVHLTMRNWLRQAGLLHKWTEKAVSRVGEVLPEAEHEHGTTAVWRAYLPHAQQVLASDLVSEESAQRVELLRKYGRCVYSDGRWNEAEAMFYKIVEIEGRVHSKNSGTVQSGWLWLASTYSKQGRWSEAEEIQESMVEIRKTELGVDHPETLLSMNNLASTYLDQSRLAEAERLQLQAVNMQKKRLGAEHSYTLKSMNNLALMYSNQGRNAEAEQIQLQLLEIRETKPGEEHPDTLMSMNNLALTYSDQEWWAEAERLQRRVLEIRKTKLDEGHHNILTTMNNLASTYSAQGRNIEAEQLQLYVLERYTAEKGEEHPDTLMGMNNLAITYSYLGRFEEAVQLMRKCVEHSTRLLGATHPRSVSSREMLLLLEAESSRRSRVLATRKGRTVPE